MSVWRYGGIWFMSVGRMWVMSGWYYMSYECEGVFGL